MIEQGGIDATDSFEDIGHSSDARDIMMKFKIGTLKAGDKSKGVAANNTTSSTTPVSRKKE